MASLPRRALLGVELGEPGGASVRRVRPGSTADAAGLQPGDVLLAIDGALIRSVEDAKRVTRTLGERATLRYARGEETIEREATVTRWPAEQGAEYGHVEVDGQRLRTLRTGDGDVGLLLMQGIARTSMDFALTPDAPLARLIASWTDAGLSTLRVERWGVGDSEGDAATATFARELAAYRAALDAWSCGTVFAFGHSLGGMALPLLERPLAGAMVYGTSARRWSACMSASAERQMRLRGADEATIADELARLESAPSRHGVTAGYLDELEHASLADAWRRFTAPLLVLYGEHDWVVSHEESDELAALVTQAHVHVLPGLDHAFGRHADQAASLRDYGRGAPDMQVGAATVSWVRGILAAKGER